MATPYIVDQANYSADPAHSLGSYISVALPYHQANDIIVLVCNYYPSPNPASVPAAPSGWSAASSGTHSGADRINSDEAAIVWWWRRATDSSTPPPAIVRPDATGATDSDSHLSATAFVVRGCVTFGDPFEGRANSGAWEGTAGEMSSPAFSSAHANALAILVATSAHYGLSKVSVNSLGFLDVSSKFSFTGAGAATAVMSRPIEIQSFPAAPCGWASNAPGGNSVPGTVFSLVAIPTIDVGVGEVPITSVPIAGEARDHSGEMILGCADEYEVFITGPDYETRIDAVRWSSLDWERVLDEPSTAHVSLPDQYGGASCCARFGGLKPWRYGLLIERNGQKIWSGPVTNLSRRAGVLNVTAADCFARFKRRLATRSESLRFVNNDAGQMFADICNTYARVETDQWIFNVPQVTTGISVTRNVVAREFSYAWNVIKDMLDSSIDAYVLAGRPVVFQPGYGWVFVDDLGLQYYLAGDHTSGGELVYGLFSEEAFVEIPEWSIDGFQQANTGVVVGADSGQSGFRKYWTAAAPEYYLEDSVLDIVETATLYRPELETTSGGEGAFQRQVDSLVQLRAQAPAVIDSVSLSQAAPINVDHLRPGSIWRLDVWDACWGQLLQASRLKRVKGEASMNGDALAETINATLYPLGYTEGDV